MFAYVYVYSRHQSQSPIDFDGSAPFFARSFEYGGFAGKDLPAAGGLEEQISSKCQRGWI